MNTIETNNALCVHLHIMISMALRHLRAMNAYNAKLSEFHAPIRYSELDYNTIMAAAKKLRDAGMGGFEVELEDFESAQAKFAVE